MTSRPNDTSSTSTQRLIVVVVKIRQLFGFLNWWMLLAHGTSVARVKKVKWSSQKVKFAHTYTWHRENP
jgi:hypothetical protein